MSYTWQYDKSGINWTDLSNLYKSAPLGDKSPDDLELVFSNSRYMCFVFGGNELVGAGRALADGRDCSYICDIAVHPEHQGKGLGKQIIKYLIEKSKGYRKIILYAEPGKEGLYARFGFKKMNTAMGLFENEKEVIRKGTISDL